MYSTQFLLQPWKRASHQPGFLCRCTRPSLTYRLRVSATGRVFEAHFRGEAWTLLCKELLLR